MRFLIVFESSRVQEIAAAQGFSVCGTIVRQAKSARPNVSDGAMTLLQQGRLPCAADNAAGS
jgi:hypothetical protein